MSVLSEAAARLMSPIQQERESGEAILLSARAESVPALVSLLTAPVPPGGVSPLARAALLLGALKGRDAVRPLSALIENGKANAAELPFVARALAELVDGRDAFDDDVRIALERLAASNDPYARAFAAEAFGSLGDQRSKSRVVALSQDKEPWVREKASAVLLRLAEQERHSVGPTPVVDGADVSVADFAALVQQAESEGGALKPWLDDLADTRRAVRDNAVAELVRAGKPAVPFLIQQLNQPQPRARIGAATALSRLQPPEAAGPLLIAATHPASTAEEQELRPIALRALANCLTGVEEGLAASILPLTRDPDRFVRAAALLCLGRLADRKGMKAVVAAILEDDPFVTESAAIALSEGVREEDGELVPPLLLALSRRPEPRGAVKEAILIALSRIQIDAPALRVRVRHRVRGDVNGATVSTRKAAIVLLERMFDDADPPPLTVVDDVLARLHDEHPEVRVVAASFLSRHLEPGLTGAVDKLIAALSRGERTVSLLCLEALRKHDTPAAKEAVDVVVRSPDEAVADRARELARDWVPQTAPWVFVPKTVPPTPAAGVTDSQRPRRVRGVAGDDVTPDRPIVQARFNDTDKPA
ncbi:MAG: HEAT repeat domain-containing protein [Deltaproteobacteria bacterium]|nr:HEAT repeat domain-containing protein [Deltaproteobacteria bacterium]